MSQELSLDGEWCFAIDPENAGRREEWQCPREGPPYDPNSGIAFSVSRSSDSGVVDPIRDRGRPIHVPSCWEESEEDYEGVAWYSRTFCAPAAWPDCSVRLQFDAVNYLAEVWLNGAPVGDHEGGYTPFELDITDIVLNGQENILVVRVVGPAVRTPGHDVLLQDEAPHWRGGYVGGIWQSVRIVASAPTFVKDVFVKPRMSESAALLSVRVANVGLALEELELKASIVPEGRGQPVAEQSAHLVVPPGGIDHELLLPLEDPHLWSPDDPFLYRARVTLRAGGEEVDAHSVRFGMRELTIEEGFLRLNGERLFLKGAFHEGLYPSTLAHPGSEEIVRREIGLAKEAGLNMLRPWRIPPVPMFLDIADEMGILLTGSPPSECMRFPRLTPQLERRWARNVEDMVLRDRNHPSVVCWEIGNELMRRLPFLLRHKVALVARRNDTTRLILDESGADSASYGGRRGPSSPALLEGVGFRPGAHYYLPGSTVPTPALDLHIYRRAPVSEADYVELNTCGKKGLLAVVSEVGYGSLPDLPRNVERYRREGNPKTPDYRFHGRLLESLDSVLRDHELAEVFADVSGLCRASQELQAQGNLLQLEAIRLNPLAGGYVLHAFTDGDYVLGAGIVDLFREPKPALEQVRRLNRPLYLGVHAAPQNAGVSGSVQAVVTAANEMGPVDATVVLELEGSAWRKRQAVHVGPGVQRLLEVGVPLSEAPGSRFLSARLLHGDLELAISQFALHLFDQAELETSAAEVLLVDEAGLLTSFFEARQCRTRPLTSEDAVTPGGVAVVVPEDPRGPQDWRRFTRLARWVKEGGTALWLEGVDVAAALAAEGLFPVRLAARRSVGNWISVAHYARRHPVFAGLPAGGILGQPWHNVAPRRSLPGIPGAVPAGCVSWDIERSYVGPLAAWHGADLVSLPWGEGQIVVSMFRLVDHVGKDPLADWLLCNLIGCAARGEL
jgi:hypothetical protein